MKKKKLFSLREIVLFGLFPAIIYASQLITAALPNIHLTGMFIMLMTLLFRSKALIPLYIYVLIMGLTNGFNLWWIPYLYIWTVLWGMTMVIPRRIPDKIACFVYPIVCSLHGFAYGVLYAPAQALIFGYDMEQTVAWILSGLPFDLLHGAGNLVAGLLILPLLKALRLFTGQKREQTNS